MRRGDLADVGTGVAIGAAITLAVVFVWTEASRPAGFPTTQAALPTTFVVPTATPRPDLGVIRLAPDGIGLASFGEDGAAVVDELEGILGPPNSDESWTCPDPPGEVRFVGWADLGVFVMDGTFVGWTDAIYFPAEYGPLLGLRTTEDLHIGLMLEHFEAHLGDRFAFRDPDPNPEDEAREFDIDGPDGIHGFVEDAPDGPRVIALAAGTTCFDDNP
jgi:hypothetical protein